MEQLAIPVLEPSDADVPEVQTEVTYCPPPGEEQPATTMSWPAEFDAPESQTDVTYCPEPGEEQDVHEVWCPVQQHVMQPQVREHVPVT